MKKFLLIFIGAIFFFSSVLVADNYLIKESYVTKQSDVQVEGVGKVVKILRDDNKGTRHQRFILKLDVGITVLIAHNIDLAHRIKNLRVGDTVSFYGEYEYNKKGGVVHWTHDDPRGRHENGWLMHRNIIYH